MSVIAQRAELDLWLCDFAAVDSSSGKVNMLGAGVRVVGFDPIQGVTTRFVVVGRVALPSELAPVEVPVELGLYDESGVVSLGATPEPQAVRLAQITKFEKPNVVGQPSLPGDVPSQHVLTLEVAGLPLQPGRSYSWQLRVDGDDDRAVRYTFMVPGLAGPRIVQG